MKQLKIMVHSGLSSMVASLIIGSLYLGFYLVRAFFKQESTQLFFNQASIVTTHDQGSDSLVFNFTAQATQLVSLFVVCLAIGIYLCLTLVKQRKVLLVFGLLVVLLAGVIGYEQITKLPTSLKVLTTAQLDKKIHDKADTIVYVGRDSCPYCIAYLPKLQAFLKTHQLTIDYYDTSGSQAAINNYRKHYQKLGVKTVPAVIQIKQGQVVKILNGETEQAAIENLILDQVKARQ